MKLTKNADLDKYKYSDYDIGFDFRSEFLFTDGTWGKNVIIFGADMSSSVHIENKNKDILILGAGPTQGLDDTTLTAKLYILLILHNQIKDLHIIMEATASYLLVPQKYISSKQKTLK